MSCVETSINALSQSKEISNSKILSVNQTVVKIDIGEDGKREK